jgi:hypothetical protein
VVRFAAAEQQPAGFPEDRGAALTFHAAGLIGTDIVQCLVHVGDDVEAVEDMQRLAAVFADELQIRLPHVGADEYDFRNDVLAHSGEESLEGFDGSFFAYPEQAGHAQIDLVDKGEIFVTSGVLDFVDSDGVNRAKHTVLQAQVTTCSTASKTLSQEVRNASAVSFQENRRAQRARNSM